MSGRTRLMEELWSREGERIEAGKLELAEVAPEWRRRDWLVLTEIRGKGDQVGGTKADSIDCCLCCHKQFSPPSQGVQTHSWHSWEEEQTSTGIRNGQWSIGSLYVAQSEHERHLEGWKEGTVSKVATRGQLPIRAALQRNAQAPLTAQGACSVRPLCNTACYSHAAARILRVNNLIVHFSDHSICYNGI